MDTPQPYSEKIRLAEIISDARAFLAEGNQPVLPAVRLGQAEALLKMLADSAGHVASQAPELALIAAAYKFAGVPDPERLAATFLAQAAADAETLAEHEQAARATVNRIMGKPS